MLTKLTSWMIPAVPRRIVHQVARRYIAGESKEQAIELAARLGEQGFVTTLDMLGEDIESLDQAAQAAAGYADLIAAMARAGVPRNISIKLTQLGLRLDPDRAFDQLRRVLDAAAEHDTFVRIDMEDSSITDPTIEQMLRAREIWPRVGTVLQARLRRTADDARRLAAIGANLRLCKGIYREPKRIAFKRKEEIRESYLTAARALLAGGAYVGLATHDVPLIEKLEVEIDQLGVTDDRFEFQALLGVPMRSTLERLRDAGHKVRLYVPFGAEWYAYSVRRLKESPQMAGAIAKGLFKGDRLDVDQGSAASQP
jgi:proline dehydrogenase